MNTTPRILIAAALLVALSACGNKGPLVQAPSPEAQEEQVPPADAGVPAAETEPATTEPATDVPVEEDQPVPADPIPPPPPAEDDGTP